jgi:hypothetical protein
MASDGLAGAEAEDPGVGGHDIQPTERSTGGSAPVLAWPGAADQGTGQ